MRNFASHELALGFGDRTDVRATRPLTAGETIIRFHGISPYGIHYVDPAYDPRAAKPDSTSD